MLLLSVLNREGLSYVSFFFVFIFVFFFFFRTFSCLLFYSKRRLQNRRYLNMKREATRLRFLFFMFFFSAPLCKRTKILELMMLIICGSPFPLDQFFNYIRLLLPALIFF